MIAHYEDSGPFYLQIQENIDIGIVTDFGFRLVEIPARGRHVIHCVIRSMHHCFCSELETQLTRSSPEPEEMAEEKCTSGSDQRKTQDFTVGALL